MKCHPACLLLPEIGADEFRELVEDIRNQGQRHPIIVDEDGMILDGRHRWRACQELFVEPKVETFVGTETEKVALIISENIRRRHLTTQQRGAIAAELATLKRGGDRSKASNDALTDAQAAKLMNVSEPTVERAKARMRTDPEAHEQAKAGTLPKHKPKRGATPKQMQAAAGRSVIRQLNQLTREHGHGAVHQAIKGYVEHQTRPRSANLGKQAFAGIAEEIAPDRFLAIEVCSLLRRLNEVSLLVDGAALYQKMPSDLRHKLDQDLPGAALLVEDLRASWVNARLAGDDAGE